MATPGLLTYHCPKQAIVLASRTLLLFGLTLVRPSLQTHEALPSSAWTGIVMDTGLADTLSCTYQASNSDKTDGVYRVFMGSLHKPPVGEGWATEHGSGCSLVQNCQLLHNYTTLSARPDPKWAQAPGRQNDGGFLTNVSIQKGQIVLL